MTLKLNTTFLSHVLDTLAVSALTMGTITLAVPRIGPVLGVALGVAVGYTATALYMAVIPSLHALKRVAAIQMADRRRAMGHEDPDVDPAQLLSGMRGRAPKVPIGFARPDAPDPRV